MTARALILSQLRGACPGLSAPMPTGDGLLVRLLPVGTIPLDAFGKLCAAARTHGNGIVEITARGSIQIRGLNAASAPRFADAIAALNIAAADGIPVLSNALAGLDPEEILNAGTLAADLRRALAETSLPARLAPKVSVVIDGGGALNLDSLAADVRLCAEATHSGVALRVSVGGDGASATELGAVAPSDGVETAVRLLEVIARGGRAARARDIIAANGTVAFRAAIVDFLIDDRSPPKSHKSTDAIGTHRLRDGTLACGIGLAFGHADAAALERLARAALLVRRRRHTRGAGTRAHDDRPHATSRVRLRCDAPKISASSSAPTIRGGMSSPAPVRRSVRRRISPPAPSRRASPRWPRRISALRSIFTFPAAPKAARTPSQRRSPSSARRMDAR